MKWGMEARVEKNDDADNGSDAIFLVFDLSLVWNGVVWEEESMGTDIFLGLVGGM